MAGVAEEWRALALQSSTATPFQTVEWHECWLKHYGHGKRFVLVTMREGDDLVGLAPLVFCPGPWTSLRWSGGGPSDYLHPLAAPGFERVVSEAVAGYVLENRRAQLVDLHQVRESEPFASLPDFRAIDQAVCLVLDLPRTFDEYLKSIGKSLRYDVRRLDKELFSSGKAIMDTVESDRVSSAFEIFLGQHRARWRARRLPGAFVGRSVSFHREWVQIAAANDWLRLKILSVEGTPAGAIYAMRFRDTLYYYQAGFDPSFKSVSPGTLLVASTIRSGIEEGLTSFDFMRGAEPYKRRWKPQHEYRNLRLIASRTNVRGSCGLQWNLWADQLEKRVRQRFEGPGTA